MSRNYLLIILSMVIYLRIASGANSIYCYQCSGLTCEPLEEYLLPCDNELNRQVARCFSVAWNLTNIYRGCYEQEDPFIQHCSSTRLSKCAVCDGHGCNNQPLFQPPSSLTCKQCPYGVCGPTDTPRDDYHTCGRFLMTVIPSCYQIIDYAMFAFTFGCSNQLSSLNFHICTMDVLKLSCRFCHTPNCNMIPHSFEGNMRKKCMQAMSNYMTYHYCDRSQTLMPFSHCFLELNFLRPRLAQMVGCTSSFPEREIGRSLRGINFFHCYDQLCNDFLYVRDYIYTNKYRPCIDPSERFNLTFPALMDSCCVVSEYKNELDQWQRFSGCESKINCQFPGLCRRCCDDQMNYLKEAKPTCNLRTHKFTHQCYRCENCLVVSNALLANQTNCMAEEGDSKRCFLYKSDKKMYRGCYYETPHKFNAPLNECHMDPKNCTVCRGDLCNDNEVVSFCYQCVGQNHNCRYDQAMVGYLQQCLDFRYKMITSETTATLVRPQCYTMLAMDGQVERGCVTKDFSCPPSAECHQCEGIGCNSKGYMFGYCLTCTGSWDSSCALDAGRTLADPVEKCPISWGEPLCFTFYDGMRATIERGCTTKSTYAVGYKTRCETEENSTCVSCDTNYCNYFTKKVVVSGTCKEGTVVLQYFMCIVILIIDNKY